MNNPSSSLPSDQTDQSLLKLVDQARRGDRDAQDMLFHRCRNYVAVLAHSELSSWLLPKVDTSDLIQETMLAAHRGLEEFRGTTSQQYLAWLRTILKRNATDLVRRYHGAAKRRIGREQSLATQRDDSGVALDPEDPQESPSQIVIRWEQQLQLADAVSRLPEDYQQVIVLRNLQRLPFAEVAERLGRSRPAAQMLWLRAVRRLQVLISEDSADSEGDRNQSAASALK